MIVNVDESGGQHQTGGVDGRGAVTTHPRANLGDGVAVHPDLAVPKWRSETVGNLRAGDHERPCRGLGRQRRPADGQREEHVNREPPRSPHDAASSISAARLDSARGHRYSSV